MNAPAKVTTIPVSQAKANFSEVVRRAERGEQIALTRNGKVVAVLGPDSEGEVDTNEGEAKPRSLLGIAKGEIWMADDWEELGPEWDEYIK